MLCARCGQPLTPPLVQGGGNASIVLSSDGRPLPLRCAGCGKVVCHPCQSEPVEVGDGVTAAHVSMRCTFCGDRLELVQGAAPAAPADEAPAPDDGRPSKERRRELKQAYKEEQRAVASAAPMPPGVRALLDGARAPAPAPGTGGCLLLLGVLVGAAVGYQLQPDGQVGDAIGGAVLGALVGGALEGLIALVGRRSGGG